MGYQRLPLSDAGEIAKDAQHNKSEVSGCPQPQPDQILTKHSKHQKAIPSRMQKN